MCHIAWQVKALPGHAIAVCWLLVCFKLFVATLIAVTFIVVVVLVVATIALLALQQCRCVIIVLQVDKFECTASFRCTCHMSQATVVYLLARMLTCNSDKHLINIIKCTWETLMWHWFNCLPYPTHSYIYMYSYMPVWRLSCTLLLLCHYDTSVCHHLQQMSAVHLPHSVASVHLGQLTYNSSKYFYIKTKLIALQQFVFLLKNYVATIRLWQQPLLCRLQPFVATN